MKRSHVRTEPNVWCQVFFRTTLPNHIKQEMLSVLIGIRAKLDLKLILSDMQSVNIHNMYAFTNHRFVSF